ncbi:MAG: glycosyltransferase family 39 protein [Bacteroidota bacterium]
MLRKGITSLIPDYEKLGDKSVFLILFGLSFLIRFPFFFRDYIDRDESTFILMGQSWVEGHLPYMELWDLKPPLTFLFFAACIYAFGKSFLAIRLMGSLLVAITAFFTYKIGYGSSTKKVGFWMGICCVALQSLFGSLQGVMSEHICMVFFMPGLYFLLQRKHGFQWGLSGILMGGALMTKLNIAYPILVIGMSFVFWQLRHKNYKKTLLFCVLFGLGLAMIPVLLALPYYISGNQDVWWRSVVLAPLEYSDARRYSLIKMAPTFLLLGLFFFYSWKKRLLDFNAFQIQIVTLGVLGVLLSFFKSGRINSHYLIQLHPLLIILAGWALAKLPTFKKFRYRPFVILILALLPMESYLEYYAVAQNKWERGTFYNGEGFTAPQYLIDKGLDTQNVLFLGYHIGYWILDTKPPTKAATHPSNLCRDELFPFQGNSRDNSMEELRYIMEGLKPPFVITRKNRLIFDKKEEEENAYMEAYLAKHYTVAATVDKAEILQRLE